jgi:hypothetical protein
MMRAESGDREALSELRAAIDETAEPEAWRALGRGYAKIQHNDASLEAYARSLVLEPKGAEDSTLRADIRDMANDERYLEKALALAENNMGQLGVDLLYDVWLALKSKDKKQSRPAEQVRAVLDSPDVRAKASPALKAALALEKARSCADYKKVLSEYAEHVDERSAAKLKRLQVRKGCGFLGLRDCWGCLRGKNLSVAVSNARRAAPSFAPAQAKKAAPSGSP